jgi:hypothetical protein
VCKVNFATHLEPFLVVPNGVGEAEALGAVTAVVALVPVDVPVDVSAEVAPDPETPPPANELLWLS